MLERQQFDETWKVLDVWESGFSSDSGLACLFGQGRSSADRAFGSPTLESICDWREYSVCAVADRAAQTKFCGIHSDLDPNKMVPRYVPSVQDSREKTIAPVCFEVELDPDSTDRTPVLVIGYPLGITSQWFTNTTKLNGGKVSTKSTDVPPKCALYSFFWG